MTQSPVHPSPAPAPPAAPPTPVRPSGRERVALALRRRLRSAAAPSVTSRVYLVGGITLAALAVLFTALAVATVSARDGLRVIGHDAGPQVVATADLYFALADMDAQVASALLMGPEPAWMRELALERYEQRRTEAARALLQASDLAGDDPVEQRTIQDVLDGLGRYEQLAAEALLLDEQGGYPPGPPPREVLDTYREATDLMSRQLLPQAYNLTLESGTVVRATYDTTRATVLTGRGVVWVGGALALGSLVWLQVFLARRFHRRLSPALLVATAVTAMYAFTGVTVLGKEAAALEAAKQDGFDTVLALARARAVSASMYADQSRYLLDPDRADTYEQVYFDKLQSLLYLEAGNLASYGDRLPEVYGTYATDGGIPGLLGVESGIPERVSTDVLPADPPEETRHLLLPGERHVSFSFVGNVLAAFERFQEGDQRMRTLAVDGHVDEAVKLQVTALDARSQHYGRTLGWLTGVFNGSFQRAVGDGEDAMDGLEFLLPVAMLSIAVLGVAGVVPRLREYR